MNISVKPRTVKTADNHLVREGDILYYLRHHMNGCWIYKFKCKHWANGSLVFGHILRNEQKEYIANIHGFSGCFYPEKEDNAYCYLRRLDVYKFFDNAKKSYFNRVKKMSKIKLIESECKLKVKTYE